MDHAEVRKLADQFIDALHALEDGEEGDVEDIVALFSDDAQLTNAALTLAGEQRNGHEGVQKFWTEYRGTLGKARSEFHQITANEEAAGLFWKTTGTDAEDQPLEYDGVSLLVFDGDGKIAHFHGYYDTRQLSKQKPAVQQ